MAEKKKTIAEKIEERVQAWLDSANSFSEGAKAQYSTEGYRGNTKEYYDSVTASVAASQKEAETIRKMLQGYGSYVGDDYVKKVTKYLDDFGGYENQILAAAKQDYEYFSRFADENAYTQYKAGEKNRADIDALDASALKQKLDSANSAKSIREEINRLQSISDSDIYNKIWSAGYRGDKAEKFVEQYKKGIADEISKYQAELDTYEGITDIAYTTPDGKNVSWQSLYDRKSFEEDLAMQIAQAKSDPDYNGIVAQANLIPSGAMLSRDDNRIAAYRGVFGERSMMRGEQNKDVKLARAMTKDEADLYGYYLMTQGVGRAEEYFRSMYETLDRRATENLATQWKGIAYENPGLSSAISVGGTLASGAEYLADIAMQIATGKEQYNTTSAVTAAIRGTVAEEIDWTIGNWDAGAFVYNTFMSGVDSLVAGLTLRAGGGIALGLSAAASATNDALDRGLSNKQAFWNGLASGVFEGLFETISIGQFGAMKDAIVHGGKDFAKNLVKSMVTNATEEFATEVANVLYDNLINLDYSQYETDKRMYVALGMSEEEANRKASEQLISQIGEAAASGALMGIGFGAVGSSISGVRSMMSDIDTGAVIAQNNMIAPLVELAKETTSPNSKAYRLAEKVTDKTSARRIGALMREVGYALTEQNKTDITNSLIERGMDAREAKKTATSIADIAGAESVDKAIEQAEKNGVIIDDTVEAVIRDVVLNPESAVGSRSSKLAEYGTRLTDSVVRSAGMKGISEEDAVNLKKEAEFYGIGADEFLASAQASNATPAHFSRAFKERYLQGKIGDKTVSKYVNSYLSETEQNTAYRLGEIAAKAERESAQKSEAAMPKKKVESGTGRVTVDSSVSAASREGAKTQIQAVAKIAEALGIRVRFYESVVSENGNRVLSTNKDTAAPNGWFDKDTNTVHLDIKAGKDGKGFVMFTLAHELTHFIAKWSKTQFNVLADFVTERYNKEGKDITRTIRNRMKNLAEQNIKSYMALTTEEARYEYAREEVIADSMETMLVSGNVMRDLADLRTQSEGLFNKIRGFLKQFADKIRKLYQKISPETAEGKFIAESKDTVEELEKLFANALKVSAENYAAADVSIKEVIEQDVYGKNVVMNLRLTETHVDSIEKAYNASEATVPKDTLIDRYKAVISIWKKLGGELNSAFLKKWDESVGKDRSFTLFKKQTGYKYNVELSTMCKKGVPLFEAIDFIVRQEVMKELGKKTLGKAEKEILYDILKSHNFEIPCAICYVEQARQREGAVIDAFLDGKKAYNKAGKATTYKLGWNEVLKEAEKEMKKLGIEYSFSAVDRSIATDAYVPTDTTMDQKTQVAFYQAMKKIANKEIARYNAANPDKKNRPLLDKMTNEEFKKSLGGNISNFKIIRMLIQNPAIRFTIENDLLYSSMTTLNLASAHNDLYSLFNSQGGVSGYKSKQGAIIYWGDILAKKWKSSELRKEGGVRNQSNSDFQMYTLLDQVQMYVDFTAKGYYLQAYTKVLAELKLFGKSRAKINASLIPRVYVYKTASGEIDVQRTMENAGLDENGSLIFDDVEGIPHKEAFMLLSDPEYSKSVGGVCIGYSDNHILKLLDDTRVQLIIGFHDKTDNPDSRYKGAKYAKNYNGLNEAVNAKGETVHVGFNQFVQKAEKMFTYDKKSETFKGNVDYNGKTYAADDIPRLAADLYLEFCEEKDYQPAYTDFDSHPNYYKLLADFSLYDSEGHYAPHKKVAFNMPTTVPYLDTDGSVKHESSEKYIKKELQKELAVRDSLAEALSDTSENGIIPQFKKRITEAKPSHTPSDNSMQSTRSTTDSAYLDAVSRGDKVTAQKMVDEAARKAGYNSPKLYHGTKTFGFTKVKTSGVEEGFDWSPFFAANMEEVASTYVPYSKVRDVYSSMDEDAAEESIESAIEDRRKNISNLIDEFRYLIDRHFSEWVFGQSDNSYLEELVEEANPEAGNGDGVYDVLSDLVQDSFYDYQDNFEEYEDFGDWSENSPEGQEIFSKIVEIEGEKLALYRLESGESLGGIYQLYANLDNMYVIDGNGTAWNNLRSEDFPKIERYGIKDVPYKTRDVANWARENGYYGVIFKNIRDAGEYGKAPVGDVYAFFYPESQVKSADPVTYDDDGNVIPLSERFQSENTDIRYQPRETREYTDRELLADALDSVATSEDDRKKLTQYKKKVAEADELDRTLTELRAKKKALEEAKAKRSEIRAVQDEITKTQNRITIIDKQLFDLQATVSMKRVLESEKKRRANQARAKQKASDDAKRKKAVSDAVKEAEDDYQKKLDAQKKHQAEIEAKRKERASRTELRHKIIDKVKKLSDKLRNPSKDKHIPASLQKPVARFLSAISIDTFGADQMINRNLKKLEALLDKLEKATNDIDRSVLMDKIAELQKSIQWEEAIGVSIKEKAATMRSAYEALANDKDPRVQDGYDQVVADMLKEVVEVCGDTPLRYMTLDQLTTLNDAINAVNKRVSESNKAFSEGKKKTIEEYAEATSRELPDTSKASVVKFVKVIKRFGWGLLKPATAMEIIGSQTFTELYENIQDGEETWMQNIAKAKAFFQEIATKHGYYSWDLQKTYDFVDTRGKTFTLTLGEMLSLYAYSRRPQAAKHLEEGGFKFDEKSDDRRKKLKDRKNDKENHKLNRDILKVIENKIGETEGALEFANELQAYLSKDMAALGNEISMRMYDYLAFGEENYFPIYSSKSYIDFNPDSQGNILLKNRSFTKSVAKGANNPIIVGDFVDIWTRHVNEMITYNAFALPVEDFMRTYNFKFKTADGSQDSIKDRIVRAYGEDAAKYVEQLLKDINGGVIADHSAEFADALVTRFKKLKVMLSASVVIQQPSAMARAFAMIDPKYFRGIGVGNHQERWERVMKYAPIAMIKAMGRFDINLGQSAQDYLTAQEYSGTKEKAKAVFTDKNYRDEVLTRAPAYADEMAWITIFEACEREMAEFRPDLEKGSEKFMQLVGRRFTEVIRATQVYDSVFSRSQIMRSKNVFAKMITAFMSEPTTTLNMAFLSMLEASRSGKKWYALPFNRTMAAVSTSIILNSLLVSLVYAMRDDDEDETYLESYLESFTTEVADGFNPLTYIPFVKDIWSLLQGYDVERTDMALWSDIIDKAYDFIKVFNTETSEMSEEAYDKWLKDVWSHSASAVSEILSFATGIPITNVIRDASGAVDTTVDALTSDRENSWDTMLDAIAEGFKNTLPGSNLKPNNPAKYDPTYSDYTSYKPKDAFAQFDRGNTAKGKEIIDKLIKARMEAGDTETEAKASLRSSFTRTYKDAYKKAYLAGDNAECVRIRKLLKESGLFPNYIETYMSWQKEALQDKYKK
jgi:hypothetical protein